MNKIIMGGIFGAGIATCLLVCKLVKLESQNDLMKHKYEEEQQRRKASDCTAGRYKVENFKLKDELAAEKNKNAQKTESVSSIKVFNINPQSVTHKNTEDADEEPLRCIRL